MLFCLDWDSGQSFNASEGPIHRTLTLQNCFLYWSFDDVENSFEIPIAKICLIWLRLHWLFPWYPQFSVHLAAWSQAAPRRLCYQFSQASPFCFYLPQASLPPTPYRPIAPPPESLGVQQWAAPPTARDLEPPPQTCRLRISPWQFDP